MTAKSARMTKDARDIALFAFIAAAYYVTASIGLGFDAVSGFATLVWPPTGIALATAFLLGARFLPAVTIGAFAVNVIAGAPEEVALGIAIGNTAEAFVGALLLRAAGFRASFERLRDAYAFIFLAAAASTLVSATVGTASLYYGGIAADAAIAQTWIAWWVGDILGALVVGSLLIAIFGAKRGDVRLWRTNESMALIAVLVVTNVITFIDPFHIAFSDSPLSYLVFIPLIWAAQRFGPIGTTFALAFTAGFAIWGTANGTGPFAMGPLNVRLLHLQFFMGIAAVVSLITLSANEERRAAEAKLEDFNGALAKEVAIKTAELIGKNEELRTSKRMFEKRGAVLNAILHSIGEGVAAIDAAGKPLLFNPAAAALLGAAPSQLTAPIESTVENFPAYYIDGTTKVPFGDLPIIRALNGEATVNERLILKPPHRPEGVMISVSGAPVRNERGAIIGSVVVFREVAPTE